MKKLKLKLDGIKDMLTKTQMKKVVGGGYGGGSVPNSPGSSGDGGGGSGMYKCCWTNTSNCSNCVSVSSNATCVSGATLTAC